MVVESHRKRKNRTRGNHGSRRKSAITLMKVSRHAIVAWQKRKLQKMWDPGKLWTAEGIDCCQNEEECRRLKAGATSGEGNYNWQWHQRIKQETGAMSEKPEDIIRDPGTNFQVGSHGASSRDFH
jgi:hypothetical protein